MALFSRRGKLVVVTSDALRWASRWLTPLRYVADSLYVVARKNR
jgi:hypothetical protein